MTENHETPPSVCSRYACWESGESEQPAEKNEHTNTLAISGSPKEIDKALQQPTLSNPRKIGKVLKRFFS
jgi:hypothetical protein